MPIPPKPPPKGTRYGGRGKGTPNKRSLELRERFAELGYDPFAGMVAIAMNNLPCGVCRGQLRTRYLVPKDHRKECDHRDPVMGIKIKPLPGHKCIWCSGSGTRNIDLRTCQSCYGTGFEACSPELRGKMHAEAAQYVEAKRKAIEHSDSKQRTQLMDRLLAGRERAFQAAQQAK